MGEHAAAAAATVAGVVRNSERLRTSTAVRMPSFVVEEPVMLRAGWQVENISTTTAAGRPLCVAAATKQAKSRGQSGELASCCRR